MRRAARTDANQSAIVEALRKVGATVTPTHMVGGGFPDITVGYRGRTFLFEIKSGDRWKLTNDEFDWHERWTGQAAIVTDPEQAIAVIAKKGQT
jgi:hypothetical protein